MFNIVFFYLYYFHAFASAADEEDDELFASPSVCSLDNSSFWFNTEIQSGLNAKWYTFDQYLPDGSWNYDYRSPQYMSSGYSDFSCYHMERYLQNMDFDTPWPSNGEVEYGDYIYGYNTTYTNLTLELTGLYKAPLTGNYTFTFISSDDSAVMFIGDEAYNCDDVCHAATGGLCWTFPHLPTCQCYETRNPDCINAAPTFVPGAIPTSENGSNYLVNGIDSNYGSGTASLTADGYYAIRIVYTNGHLGGSLALQATLPNSTVVTDMSSSFFSCLGVAGTCENSATTSSATDFSPSTTATSTATSSLSSNIFSSSTTDSSDLPASSSSTESSASTASSTSNPGSSSATASSDLSISSLSTESSCTDSSSITASSDLPASSSNTESSASTASSTSSMDSFTSEITAISEMRPSSSASDTASSRTSSNWNDRLSGEKSIADTISQSTTTVMRSSIATSYTTFCPESTTHGETNITPATKSSFTSIVFSGTSELTGKKKKLPETGNQVQSGKSTYMGSASDNTQNDRDTTGGHISSFPEETATISWSKFEENTPSDWITSSTICVTEITVSPFIAISSRASEIDSLINGSSGTLSIMSSYTGEAAKLLCSNLLVFLAALLQALF